MFTIQYLIICKINTTNKNDLFVICQYKSTNFTIYNILIIFGFFWTNFVVFFSKNNIKRLYPSNPIKKNSKIRIKLAFFVFFFDKKEKFQPFLIRMQIYINH